jgi:hypothetical protein
MITEFDELNIYPEYPKPDIVEMFANYVLDHSQNESRSETLKKLMILSDKQYHTNTQPDIKLKERIQEWLTSNWTDNILEFPDNILTIAHSFALEKIIFEKALKSIQEDKKSQWLLTLQNSDGLYINPWWNSKKKNN